MKPVFPELCRIADRASSTAQRTYFSLSLSQLAFLAMASVVAGISASTDTHKRACAWSFCAFMLCSLGCSIALKTGQFDVRWFKCRAFAENAKSMAWRYVMVPSACATKDEDYLREWTALRKRLPELQSQFALSTGAGELITDWMRKSSSLDITQKVKLYRDKRLDNQRGWYSKKSRENARRRALWFWIVLAVDCGVIAYAAIQAWLLLSINLVGFVTTIGAGMLAWSQLKRFSDLATTYSVAAEDLSEISARYRIVDCDDTLEQFVLAVEDAVSREHSMWLARREC